MKINFYRMLNEREFPHIISGVIMSDCHYADDHNSNRFSTFRNGGLSELVFQSEIANADEYAQSAIEENPVRSVGGIDKAPNIFWRSLV